MSTRCDVINCNRPSSGTALQVGVSVTDVCEACGIHFWGNFTPYPADEPIDYDDPIDEYRHHPTEA